MIVRPAVPDDVEAVARVHVEAWQSTYQGHMPAEVLDGLTVEGRIPMWRAAITEPRDRSGVLVAQTDVGEVVGFCHYAPSRDDDADPSTGEVTSIYVLQSQQRRGAGSVLLDAATLRLQEIGFASATLWVLDSNASARAFYFASGWSLDGATKTDNRGTYELHEVRYVKQLSATVGADR